MVEKIIHQLGGAEHEAEQLKKSILCAKSAEWESVRTFYVSENGNDDNNGLSPEYPIKSLEAVKALPLKSGDKVVFERGSVFRWSETLKLKSGVRYGAYGIGEKPAIYGSLRDYADASLWEREEGAIWMLKLETSPAGLINFNNDTLIGVWKYTKDELKKDGDFYHDSENGILYLYFEGENPGDAFDNIEIGTTMKLMEAYATGNIQVDNICFKYCTFGPFLFSEISDLKISNCIMGWHGGKVFSVSERGVVRYGNAVEIWYRGINCVIENCWIYQVFDAALTFQGHSKNGSALFVDIRFENNLVEYCSMNFEYWAGKKGSIYLPHIADISYTGNIIRFAGYGWGGIQRFDKEDQASLLGWNRLYDHVSNFVVTDNILDCADCYMIYMKSPSEQKGLSVFNNTYYQKQVSGAHDHVSTVKDRGVCASDQQELEAEISTFDSEPKLIKWLG